MVAVKGPHTVNHLKMMLTAGLLGGWKGGRQVAKASPQVGRQVAVVVGAGSELERFEIQETDTETLTKTVEHAEEKNGR